MINVKKLGYAITLSCLISAFGGGVTAFAAEESLTQDIGQGTNSGSSEVVYDTADEQNFTVVIPKKIVLGSDKTGSYNITVKGDVAQGSRVMVEPQDDVLDRDGTNFVMTSTKSGGTKNVDIVQNDIYWNYADITANSNAGTVKSGSINGNELTFGIWNGNLTYLINFEDEYQQIVVDGWVVKPDDADNTIRLLRYIGPNPDVVAKTSYEVEGKTYTTKLPNKLRGWLPTNIQSFKLESGVDTSNVTGMDALFKNCENLTSVDLSAFDTSNVQYMNGMFFGCKNLASIDVSNFNTSKVVDMRSMFEGCNSLASLDVTNFNTSNTMYTNYMFANCSSLTSLDVSRFDTSKVINMNAMFGGCSGVTQLNVSNFDTSNVESMSFMFNKCSSLTSLDVSNFDTSKVTKMNQMFQRCSSLTSLDVSNFDTSNVQSMINMFGNLDNITTLDLSNFNTSNVTDMTGVFSGSINLEHVDVSSFDTSNVTSMMYMFSGCKVPDLDVTNFDTSKVTDMKFMFSSCRFTSIDLSNFDTSNVKDMSSMFKLCGNVTEILADNTKWTVSDSTNITEMFYRCGVDHVTYK